MSQVEARLRALGIDLPAAATPAANYIPWMRVGALVFIAGQVTARDGRFEYIGKLGREYGVEEGRAAARLVALNVLAQLRDALDGDLDRVRRCVKLGGFVNATPEFTDHPKVMNGASELMIEAFGDAGRHTRTAVGVAGLPFGVAVEIDAIFEVDGP